MERASNNNTNKERNAESVKETLDLMGVDNSNGPSHEMLANILNLNIRLQLHVEHESMQLIGVSLVGEQKGGAIILLLTDESHTPQVAIDSEVYCA